MRWSSDDDEDDVVIQEDDAASTPPADASSSRTIPNGYVHVVDLQTVADGVGAVKNRAENVDNFAVSCARDNQFYKSLLSQVKANDGDNQQHWIRTAVTLTNYSREQVLSDSADAPVLPPSSLCDMAEHCIYIPWTRMSITVASEHRIKLEGWMLLVINAIAYKLYDGLIDRVFCTKFMQEGARTHCTMIKLYLPTAIADIAVQHCNTVFGAILSALNGFCNESNKSGVRNPKPGNEDSKVNKFLTGLSSELDKNFTEKKTFTNRIRDCFEEGQRKDIKAKLKTWMDGHR